MKYGISAEDTTEEKVSRKVSRKVSPQKKKPQPEHTRNKHSESTATNTNRRSTRSSHTAEKPSLVAAYGEAVGEALDDAFVELSEKADEKLTSLSSETETPSAEATITETTTTTTTTSLNIALDNNEELNIAATTQPTKEAPEDTASSPVSTTPVDAQLTPETNAPIVPAKLGMIASMKNVAVNSLNALLSIFRVENPHQANQHTTQMYTNISNGLLTQLNNAKASLTSKSCCGKPTSANDPTLSEKNKTLTFDKDKSTATTAVTDTADVDTAEEVSTAKNKATFS